MKKIFFLLLAAFCFRLIALDQSLWLDEAISVHAASGNIFDMLTHYSLTDFHPPLYYAILHFWTKIFGLREISVRLPSVIFGLLTIFFTYKIAEQIFPKKSLAFGVWQLELKYIPPLLLTTSGLHIYYSQEARMYSGAALAIAASIYFLLRLIDNDRGLFANLKQLFFHQKPSHVLLLPTRHQLTDRGYLTFSLLFTLCLSLALYTDYLPWLLLPLFFLIIPAHTLVSLLLTLPWWPSLTQQLTVGLATARDFPLWSQVVGGFSLQSLALIPVKFVIGRTSLDNNFIYALLLAPVLFSLAFLIFSSLRRLTRTRDRNQYITYFWLLTPVLIGTALSFKVSLLSYFRFLFILPAFYLILTTGLAAIKPKLAAKFFALILAVNLFTSAAYLFLPQFHRENWRGFSDYINARQATPAVTLIPSLAQASPYLFYQRQVPIADEIVFDPAAPPETVYLVRYVQEIFDPTDSLRLKLENLGYRRTDTRNFNGVVVWIYAYTGQIFAMNVF